ncbi:MAG TPA: TlpA disulfide reductase family protein [Polyangiaceae bacterium]|nr:TlpA disulfide reductase family protein [Polyangiaceae bacterium]
MRSTLFSFATACAASACNEDPHPPAQDNLESRGQAIVAKTQDQAPQPSKPASDPHPSKQAAPSAFCSSSSPSHGLKLPETVLPQRSAGVASLPEHIPNGNGQWSWVNLWAAWCVPCKQEIPVLLSWEQKLRAASKPFHVYFVSLDDDERQLLNFLHAQPATGLTSAYWLREGHERVDWLKALHVDPDTQLPGHFLVDPQGTVRCFISGAIEEDDFPKLQALMSR